MVNPTTYNLVEVVELLNNEASEKEIITYSQIVYWAKNDCFPSRKVGNKYRVNEDDIPLVRKTRELIHGQGYDLESAKIQLGRAVTEKTKEYEAEEKKQQISTDPFSTVSENIQKQTDALTRFLEVNSPETTEKAIRNTQLQVIEESLYPKMLEALTQQFKNQEELALRQQQENEQLKSQLTDIQRNLTHALEYQGEVEQLKQKLEEAEKEKELAIQQKIDELTIAKESEYEAKLREMEEEKEAHQEMLLKASFWERRRLKKEFATRNRS